MSSNTEITYSKYLDSDRPIACRQQDRLGRRFFAEAIACQIRTFPGESGVTIAVVGEWGTGKTSVLNMVAETLQDDSESIAHLHFNPWLFGSAEDLVTRFFRELSSQLGENGSERLKNVAKALASLGQSLAPLSPVVGTASAFGLLGKLTDFCAKPTSLHDTRDRLKQALSESDCRLLVVIDDIDRLEARETRELMRLVRLTSDLPRIVYLLAYDRHRVALSLGESLGENATEGGRYLDKIVQVNYDLPNAREAFVYEMFLPWLDEVIRGRELAELDREMWARVFYDVIKPLLGSLRDVKRYLYSVTVALDTIGQEVALADLLGLEALRILRPSIFSDLKSNSKHLTHPRSGSLELVAEDIRNREAEKNLSAMLDHAEPERSVLSSIFEHLFPVTQQFLGNTTYGSEWNGVWRRERRVACEEVLRIYLQAGLDEGMIPSREVQDLIDALTNETRLNTLLDSLDDKRLETALERIEDFEADFPATAAPIAIPTLLNRMGRLSPHHSGVFGISPRFKVTRVVYRLLKSIGNPEKLMAIMPEIVEKTDSLSGWFEVVEMVGHRKAVGHKLVREAQAEELEGQFLNGLKSATTSQLVDEWNLFGLSFHIIHWIGEYERSVIAFRLRGHLADDRFVIALLRTAVNYAYSNGKAVKQIFWDELLEVFGQEFLDAVARLAQSSSYRDLAEGDQDTIKLAVQYASGRRPKSRRRAERAVG